MAKEEARVQYALCSSLFSLACATTFLSKVTSRKGEGKDDDDKQKTKEDDEDDDSSKEKKKMCHLATTLPLRK